MLFSAYRRDDFADPDGFVAQLGVILCDFPEEVVTYVTSPKTGMQRRSKWPPTISEIVAACEEHQNYLTRLRTERPAGKAPLPVADSSPGHLANQFVPNSHARYPALCEWAAIADPKYWRYGKSTDGRDGIHIPRTIWDMGPG
jgi:hypothetical protein